MNFNDFLVSKEACNRALYVAVKKGIIDDIPSIAAAEILEKSYGLTAQMSQSYQKLFECTADMSLFYGLCPDLDTAIESYNLANRKDIAENLNNLKNSGGNRPLKIEDVVTIFESAGKFKLASQKIRESVEYVPVDGFNTRDYLVKKSEYLDILANMLDYEPVISNMGIGKVKEMADLYSEALKGEIV